MRSLIFLFLIGFGFVAGANTNGGGVFAVKASSATNSSVFKVRQTHDSIIFAEGRFLDGQWTVESRTLPDQDLRADYSLWDAIELSAQSGQWVPIAR